MYSVPVSWEKAWKSLDKLQFFIVFKKCTFCIMYWLVNIESKLIKGLKFKQVLGIRHEAIWATQEQTENIT